MRVGLVSDTHGRFDPALPRLFARCDRILHAGDVMGHEILHQLAAIAPLVAVRGNNDRGPFGAGLEETAALRLGPLRVLILHELGTPERPLRQAREAIGREDPSLVVYGHSHVPRVAAQGGRFYVNPGSAGPRRFRLPRSAGLALISRDLLRVELFDLDSEGPAPLAPAWEAPL